MIEPQKRIPTDYVAPRPFAKTRKSRPAIILVIAGLVAYYFTVAGVVNLVFSLGGWK